MAPFLVSSFTLFWALEKSISNWLETALNNVTITLENSIRQWTSAITSSGIQGLFSKSCYFFMKCSACSSDVLPPAEHEACSQELYASNLSLPLPVHCPRPVSCWITCRSFSIVLPVLSLFPPTSPPACKPEWSISVVCNLLVFSGHFSFTHRQIHGTETLHLKFHLSPQSSLWKCLQVSGEL